MLKLKIKLNFSFIIFFLFSFISAQGIFVSQNSKDIYSFYANYSRHEDLKDYNHSLSFATLLKGKIQFSTSYNKEVEYLGNNKLWAERLSIGIEYFIKPKQFLNYSISSSFSHSKREYIPSKTSFKFSLNSMHKGSVSSGMTYYPFISIKREFDGNYDEVLKNIDESTSLYRFEDFLQIGCIMTFNDFWIKPYYQKIKNSNSMFSGIEIGIWDYAIK